ncbi:MAG: hypothetical protein IKQ33_05820 [Clostridia bacterium]|nr:hypothetical protein [Clostridia bacterium]
MDKCTNEKSLVVFQENFLTKVKNFFTRFFWGRKAEYECVETEEEYNQDNSEKMEEESAEKQRKLYDFDADNTEEWPGDANVANIQDENGNIIKNESGNFVNIEENSEEEYDREVYSQAYIEKQELEQKLLNYYESIKNGITFE